jgi:hypothetical protein
LASAQQKRGISTEVELIEEVVRADVNALGLVDRNDLCLDVKGKKPNRDLIRRLRANGVLVHKGSWCSKGPRGVGILVQSITLTDELQAEVDVETANENLSEGQDFAIIMRKGAYVLERDAKGTWKILDYKKVCCPTTD